MTRTVDPLGGSYFLEALTDEIEQRASAMMAEIEERGGVVEGIEDGSLELAIADSAYRAAAEIDAGERVVVGVNRFAEDDGAKQEIPVFTVGPEIRDRQLERLASVRKERDAGGGVSHAP